MTSEAPVPIVERLSTGFVSFVVVLISVAVVAIATLLRGPVELGFWEHFLTISAALCVGAAVLGFVVGPVRMAHYFGVLWSASEPNLKQTAVIVAIVLGICAVALFGWPTW
jgi:hypothetical protein